MDAKEDGKHGCDKPQEQDNALSCPNLWNLTGVKVKKIDKDKNCEIDLYALKGCDRRL